MKIVSDYKELEGKLFDTVADCEVAEKEVDKQRKALAEKQKDVSKLKKTLAGKVDAAETKLQEAYTNYDKAKEQVRKILEESNKQMLNVLEPARQAVREAEEARTNAIIEYNKQCGPYQKIYTGDRAKEEYNRMSQQLDSIFNNFWRNFFNF